MQCLVEGVPIVVSDALIDWGGILPRDVTIAPKQATLGRLMNLGMESS
jgi:hypothetical protein